MRKTVMPKTVAAALALAALASPAFAAPPADLADLVGAKAGQAEGMVESRGYAPTTKNNWWNAGTGVCAHLSVSQGRYKSISAVKASKCGMGGAKKAAARKTACPPDVSEADRYKYPGCK